MLEMVGMLLERELSLDAVGPCRYTALHIVVVADHTKETPQLLLPGTVCVDVVDFGWGTPP